MLSLELCKARRQRLLDALPPGSVAVFPSAPLQKRNSDVDQEYRQDSDFFYLTGFVEPESWALLFKDTDQKTRFELVVRARDKERETWDGRREGAEGAVAHFGADAAHVLTDLRKVLEEGLSNREVLVYALAAYPEADAVVLAVIDTLRRQKRKGCDCPRQVHDPAALLHELRVIKSPPEIEALQRACDITVAGHLAAMRATRPSVNERQIQGVLEGSFRLHGSERNGYPCIVASGANATILHYRENHRTIGDHDLLLIDAGAEFDYLTADVTRSFPASGRFTEAQRQVYEVVLEAQLAAIAHCTPGHSFEQVHEVAVKTLVLGMLRIGLLTGEAEKIIESAGYKKYYMHRTGHWLGMDVHDVGRYKDGDASRRLVPGMVATVEPGIYVAQDDPEAPERFRGIGVRIEDDVLITPDAPRVLTAGCPKTVADLEAVLSEPRTPLPTLPKLAEL
jgi:Xaa-Pro aminopeptidase